MQLGVLREDDKVLHADSDFVQAGHTNMPCWPTDRLLCELSSIHPYTIDNGYFFANKIFAEFALL